MKQAPFFSIILPTFNRAELLQKAIASVLAQQFDNWELIVVDDGSTDNTADVVRAIDDERMRYIYQTNAERCAARNNGIKHANGSYVCFLDSDDYYLPERLAHLYDALHQRNFPCEMFYTGMLTDTGTRIFRERLNNGLGQTIFEILAANVIHCQQVCICRKILDEFKFNTRFRIGEDLELWLRIAQKYPINYLDEQYYVAVLEHQGRSVNPMVYNSGAEQLSLYQYLFTSQHSGKLIPQKLQQFMLAGSYHAIGQYHINHGKRFKAAWAIAKALDADKTSAWSKFRLNIFIKLLTFSPMQKVKGLINYMP